MRRLQKTDRKGAEEKMTPEKHPWEPLYESDPIHLTIDKHKKNAIITRSKQKKRRKTMSAIPTYELVSELRLAADKKEYKELRTLLKSAAERLVDQEKIAEYYRKIAVKEGEKE